MKIIKTLPYIKGKVSRGGDARLVRDDKRE
jgi:hypothetical protein